MILIDIRCVLLNLLQNRDKIHLSDLKKFAEDLTQKVNETYIDITDNALYGYLEDNPSICFIEDDVIHRGKSFNWEFCDRDFINRTVNREFSQKVKDALQECSANLHD